MIEAYKALAKAQAEMTGAQKKANNPHFKKAYADLGNVQDACIDALHKHGFAVFQPTGHDDLGMFVKTVLAHESGEVLECRTPLLVGKNDMQGLGSAITYARRYGLLCMSGVAPEDDDGNASVQQRHAPPPKMSDADRAKQISDDNVDLESAADLDDLNARYKAIFRSWNEGHDKSDVSRVPGEVVATKDAMKAKLTEDMAA